MQNDPTKNKIVLPGSESHWRAYDIGEELDRRFPGQDANDFAYAVEFNGTGPLADQAVEGLLMVREGERDGPGWVWLLRTHTGAHWWVEGWCDYTGWDCQSGVEWSRYDVIDVEEA